MWTLASEGPGLRPVGRLPFPPPSCQQGSHRSIPAQVCGPSPGSRSTNSPLQNSESPPGQKAGRHPHVCFSLSPSACPTAAGLGLPQPSECCHHRCVHHREEQKAAGGPSALSTERHPNLQKGPWHQPGHSSACDFLAPSHLGLGSVSR